MSEASDRILALVRERKIHVSDHAYSELDKDDILPTDLISYMINARLVEDYPDAHRGPAILVKCDNDRGQPIHAVWAISNMNPNLAVLVTGYKPDPKKWTKDFLQRIKP